MKQLLLFLLIVSGCLYAEEPPEDQQRADLEKISRTMGHLIGKNLQSMGLTLDVEALVRGMKESSQGELAPLSEDECLQALSILQEETLNIEAEENLVQANKFLESNAAKKDVVALESGKLQYQILKEGSGSAVESYNSPILRYKARYLNGKVFGESGSEEMISLDEAIAGLGKGIVGMREGEVRTLYIHPDLGYGRSGLAAPNSLLIFEVELLKADASAEAQAASQAEDAFYEDTSVVR